MGNDGVEAELMGGLGQNSRVVVRRMMGFNVENSILPFFLSRAAVPMASENNFSNF